MIQNRTWGIKTVDRLILLELLQSLAFMTALFFSLAFILLLFDELGDIIENELSFFTGLTYVMLCIPHEIAKASPIIVTLSVVLAIGRMVHRNEMLMLFIGGYHPFRLAAPLIGLLLVIMAGLYFVNEFVSSRFSAKAEMLIQMNRDTGSLDTMQGFWLYGEEGRVFHIHEYRPHSQIMYGLTIFEFRGDQETVSARLDAEQARYNDEAGAWNLYNVQAHYVQKDGSILREQFEEHPYMIGRTPKKLVEFSQVSSDPEKMSRSDLSRTVSEITAMGENPREYQIHLRIKDAFAFSVFFLGLMAFGFILTANLQSQASGVGLGLLAAISYFMVLMLGKSIAMTGFIPPWVGSWAANLICMALTVYLFWRLKKTI